MLDATIPFHLFHGLYIAIRSEEEESLFLSGPSFVQAHYRSGKKTRLEGV